MRKIVSMIGLWIIMALPVQAQVSQEVRELAREMGIPRIMSVMRLEGLEHGEQIAEAMFPARADGSWGDMVSQIYDEDRMNEVVLEGFARAIEGADVEALRGFFQSDLGRNIVTLEISARRALLDKTIEKANAARFERMQDKNDPRLEAVQQFIDVNDLIELNVVGALNSDFAFYRGLIEGGAYENPLSDDELLSSVWEAEQEIRDDTTQWLLEFLTMAYAPLSDNDLQAYIDLSKTRDGQILNTALFAGFDQMFDQVSYRLGLAAARILSSENL